MKPQENSRSVFQRPLVVTLIALFCCALWGSATPCIKIGYQILLPEVNVPSTILFAGIRFALAGVLTVLIFSALRKKIIYPKKQNLFLVAKLSLFQTVLQYLFFYIGLANTSGVKGAIITGSSVFFSILLSALIFKQEKLSTKKIIACIVGFAGIVVVNLNGLDLSMNFLGDGFALFSAISAGTSSVLIKRYSQYEDSVVLSGYQFILGGLFMIAVGLIFDGRIELASLGGLAILIYLAFLSAIAYSLWGILLNYNPVSKVTVFNFMIPVFGTLLSSLFLSEQSNVSPLNLLITLVLVCSGIFILNYVRPPKKGSK